MRRILFFIGVLLPVFFLSACDNAVQLNDTTLVLEFNSEADIEADNLSMKADIKRDKEGLTQISIKSPENLKGLIIKHNGNENSITKGDLSYKTDSISLPSSSAIVAIVDTIEYMANRDAEKPFFKDDKEMAFIGKIDAGKFELKSDRKTGFINEIKVGDNIMVQFYNQNKL